MPALSSQSYVFDPRPNYPLVTTVKRYWKPDSPYLNDPEALTLLFTHGTGFHKEQWEPAIDDLFALFDAREGSSIKVRDAWSIDAPNHGDAAVLNEKALDWGYEHIFRWEEYGRSVHLLLAGLGTGIDVDFSKRKLVAIGHSMGSVAFLLSTTYHPPINYTTLILVEPMIMTKEVVIESPLEDGAIKRRDIWPSTQEAYDMLASRASWKIWDPRVLRKFVDYGLRPLPTPEYPEKTNGVTLKCTRRQEAASYRDVLSRSRAFLLIPHVLKRFPTHIIYGDIDDYVSKDVKDIILYELSGGIQNFVSYTKVKGSGHLIVQRKPKELAERLRDALVLVPARSQARTKL